jgi:uncharacterized protein (TIGR02598 family)
MKSNARLDSFSLVEVTLALGVAAVALLGIFALLPVGMQTNHRSIEQTASTNILAAIVADLRATPRTSPPGSPTPSPQFGIPIPAAAGVPGGATTLFFNGSGQSTPSLQQDSRYQVTITFLSSGPGVKTATFVDVKVTWPAVASLSNAQGSAETFAAFDRN